VLAKNRSFFLAVISRDVRAVNCEEKLS